MELTVFADFVDARVEEDGFGEGHVALILVCKHDFDIGQS
jgi:hypothetical protein